MRTKLSLNLEDLMVDSFDTTTTEKPRGTVFGEQCTCYTQCTCPGCPTCDGYASCDATCNDTCANTCANTCDDNTCVGCDTYGYNSCFYTECCVSFDLSACRGMQCP